MTIKCQYILCFIAVGANHALGGSAEMSSQCVPRDGKLTLDNRLTQAPMAIDGIINSDYLAMTRPVSDQWWQTTTPYTVVLEYAIIYTRSKGRISCFGLSKDSLILIIQNNNIIIIIVKSLLV